MGHLGELLRQRQESLGLSLTDLQDRTKIREKYIKAILQGKYDVIPGEVYLRGFIRSIANELGIDPGEAMQAYYQDQGQATAEVPEAQPPTPAPVPKPTVAPAPMRTPESRAAVPPRRTAPAAPAAPAQRMVSSGTERKRRRQRGGAPWAVVIGLLILVVAGVWYWSTYLRTPVEQPSDDPPVVQNPPPVDEPEPPEPTTTVTLTNPGAKDLVYTVKPGPLTVNLSAIERGACWLRVVADEGTPEATPPQELTIGTRPTEEIRTLKVEASQKIFIRAGYPAALILEINGQDQGIVGGENPRTLTIMVDPTP